MVFVLTLFAIGLAGSSGVVGLFHRCPPNGGNFSALYNHCTCRKDEQTTVIVICQEITTDEILQETLSKLRNYTIDALILKSSGPLGLGSNPFRKLSIRKLEFENVNFAAVPAFRAFISLEFILEELHFVRCNVNSWSWGHGRSLIHLKTIRFEDTRLPSVLTNELVTHFPSKLRNLLINGCSVTTLGSQCFRRFSHLERLELNRNGITTIQRSMFPPTARRLRYMSLSDNPLRSIANDTFVNMPRLEFLVLNNTNMALLLNETFFPVWDQLEEMYFDNVRLNCDCDSTWMFDVPDFKKFGAPFCESHGKTLDQLSRRERSRLNVCPNRSGR